MKGQDYTLQELPESKQSYVVYGFKAAVQFILNVFFFTEVLMDDCIAISPEELLIDGGSALDVTGAVNGPDS